MDLSKIYSPRENWVHKGDFGSVLVVSGSKLYSGSATFAGVSALRAGADLVAVCAPIYAASVAAHKTPDLMVYPLNGEHLTAKHINSILDVAHVRHINSLVLGCGLGRHAATVSAIYKLISKLTVPMVLDADALFAIAQNPAIVVRKQVILTPHAGELAILLGQKTPVEDFDEKIIAAKQAALKFGAVVILKGFVDIITDGTNLITNNSGSTFMTKGGFGDTLSGICGALLARGTGMMEAAYASAFINGEAGELAAKKYGEGVMASDIFEMIPKVIRGN